MSAITKEFLEKQLLEQEAYRTKLEAEYYKVIGGINVIRAQLESLMEKKVEQEKPKVKKVEKSAE